MNDTAEEKHAKRQKAAWKKKDSIKVGDRFIWKIGDCAYNRHPDFEYGYIASGKLRQRYMWTKIGGKYWKEKIVLTVCRVYEGRNGYGPFVDYWLSPSGQIEYEDRNGRQTPAVLIVNGPDAMKMERFTGEEGDID